MTPDLIIGILITAICATALHVLILRREWRKSDEREIEAYNGGRKEGYSQCYTEMLLPIEHHYRKKTGCDLPLPPVKRRKAEDLRQELADKARAASAWLAQAELP